MARVLIRHPKTQAEYIVELADFRRRKLFAEPDGEIKTYEDAGFKIVSYADGTAYEPPKSDGG